MLSNIVSLVSITIALAALWIAVWQVRTSLRAAERTHALPVISETFREFRSAEFRASVSRLLESSELVPDGGGFDALPDDLRRDAYTVCYFFDYLGTLAAFDIIGERIIITVMGTKLMQIWWAMEKAITSERQIRITSYPPNTPPGFLVFYEHLVTRILERGGADAAKNIQRNLNIRHLSVSLTTRIEPGPVEVEAPPDPDTA